MNPYGDLGLNIGEIVREEIRAYLLEHGKVSVKFSKMLRKKYGFQFSAIASIVNAIKES